jgi:hypothetical protein
LHAHALERVNGRVHVTDVPFVQWLPYVDRVLLDFPSTASFEAAVAGVPSLTLVDSQLQLRESALSELGAHAARFAAQEEALAAVRRFLDTDAPPAPTLRPEGDDLVELLERDRARRQS